MARPGGSGPIRLRLALAFIGVALLAVALLAGLTAAFASDDVSKLTAQHRRELVRAMTVAAGAGWEGAGSWGRGGLGQGVNAGAGIGARIEGTANTGRIGAGSPGF